VPAVSARQVEKRRRQAGALAPRFEPAEQAAAPTTELPPLLARLVAEQDSTGLPPAYLPKDERAPAPEPTDPEQGELS